MFEYATPIYYFGRCYVLNRCLFWNLFRRFAVHLRADTFLRKSFADCAWSKSIDNLIHWWSYIFSFGPPSFINIILWQNKLMHHITSPVVSQRLIAQVNPTFNFTEFILLSPPVPIIYKQHDSLRIIDHKLITSI